MPLGIGGFDENRKYSQSWQIGISQNNDVWVSFPRLNDLMNKLLFYFVNSRLPYLSFGLECQRTSNRSNNRRRSTFFSHLDIRGVSVAPWRNPIDGASPRRRGHNIQEKVSLGNQKTGCIWTTKKFMRRYKNGVFVVQSIGSRSFHANGEIRGSSCKIEKCQCSVFVKKNGNRVDIRNDPSHVRSRRKRANLQRKVLVFDQFLLQLNKVNLVVFVQSDLDTFANRFSPRKQVAVMLIGSEKHHRTRSLMRESSPRQSSSTRSLQSHDANDFVYCSRRACSRPDNSIVFLLSTATVVQ